MKQGCRGQVSLEYVIVVGFMFALLIPLVILYAQTQKDTSDSLREAQLRSAGNAIRDAAERVYFAGDPAQETINVQFPEALKAITLTNTSIVFTMQGGSGTYELPIPSAAPLNGSLGTWMGIHRVQLRTVNGTVQVSD